MQNDEIREDQANIYNIHAGFFLVFPQPHKSCMYYIMMLIMMSRPSRMSRSFIDFIPYVVRLCSR